MQLIDQKRDDRLRLRTGLDHRLHQSRIEENPVGAHLEAAGAVEPFHRETIVGQLQRPAQRPGECVLGLVAGEQQQVGPAGTLIGGLEELDRDKHGGRRYLRRLQIEAPKGIVPHHRHHRDPQRLERTLRTGDRCIAGKDTGFLQPHHQRVAHRQPEADAERLVDRHPGFSRRERRRTGFRSETPKRGGGAHDLDLVDNAPGDRMARGAAGQQYGRRLGAGRCGQFGPERFAKETIPRRHNVGGLTDALLADATKRSGDRIPRRQRPQQHRRPQHGPGKHAQVGEPVVDHTLPDETKRGHRRKGLARLRRSVDPTPAGRSAGDGGQGPDCA